MRQFTRLTRSCHLGFPALAPLAVIALSIGPASAQDFTRPTSLVSSCTNSGCHSKVIDYTFMHAPVAQLECLECHTFSNPDLHLFDMVKPMPDLCIDCHEPDHSNRVVHKPVADGDCLSCHKPHGSSHQVILKQDPAKGLCLDCHQQDYSEFSNVHGPVAVGACVICHESHSSPYAGLLTESPAELCIGCHEDQSAKHLGIRRVHKPLEEGCTSCHDPHASNAPFQLQHSTTELCVSCHTGIKESLESAHTVHGPATTEGGCADCHDPHFSKFPRLQRESQPDLCLKCHDQPVATEDGRILTNMAKLLEENPNHHGPIREGSCTMCHQPHASEENTLLMQAYPPEFYAPYKAESYQLCFTCHQADLVTDESGKGLTGFRNGDQNLHWLHVNREKGRTCRACHEVHASQRPFHIRESVPFGSKGWMLELNYEQTADGGSCSPGCHKPVEYNRSFSLEDVGESP